MTDRAVLKKGGGRKLRLEGHAWRFASHWITETLPQSQCLTFCSLTHPDPPETGEKQYPGRYLTNVFLCISVIRNTAFN